MLGDILLVVGNGLVPAPVGAVLALLKPNAGLVLAPVGDAAVVLRDALPRLLEVLLVPEPLLQQRLLDLVDEEERLLSPRVPLRRERCAVLALVVHGRARATLHRGGAGEAATLLVLGEVVAHQIREQHGCLVLLALPAEVSADDHLLKEALQLVPNVLRLLADVIFFSAALQSLFPLHVSAPLVLGDEGPPRVHLACISAVGLVHDLEDVVILTTAAAHLGHALASRHRRRIRGAGRGLGAAVAAGLRVRLSTSPFRVALLVVRLPDTLLLLLDLAQDLLLLAPLLRAVESPPSLALHQLPLHVSASQLGRLHDDHASGLAVLPAFLLLGPALVEGREALLAFGHVARDEGHPLLILGPGRGVAASGGVRGAARQ
mmetsp:Transcript_25350/g.84703  ORF Transcript_25350/g.84703 Transcript_25350/m.84703 type:complete len:376 (-) Transcript_25350:351-1478(-)